MLTTNQYTTWASLQGYLMKSTATKSNKPPLGANTNLQTPTKTNKKIEPTSESHYSSSAFLNSPDPSQLPIPVFDDEVPEIQPTSNLPESTLSRAISDSGSKPIATAKTDTLRTFLNIRPATWVEHFVGLITVQKNRELWICLFLSLRMFQNNRFVT